MSESRAAKLLEASTRLRESASEIEHKDFTFIPADDFVKDDEMPNEEQRDAVLAIVELVAPNNKEDKAYVFATSHGTIIKVFHDAKRFPIRLNKKDFKKLAGFDVRWIELSSDIDVGL